MKMLKVRDIEIKFGSVEDMKKEVLKSEGKERHVIYLPDARTFSKIFSARRIELLRAIKENPELGVSELARLLGRKQEAVSRDIAFLRAWGLIETTTEDRKVLARSMPGKIVVEI